jgi:AraC family transcriptional regulator
MVSLQSGFSAGSVHWYQFGPSHHPPRRYDRIKLSILLGNTSARSRAAANLPWHSASAGAFSLCVSDFGHEVEYLREGEVFALKLDREFISKTWALASEEERRLYDVRGARDPFLFHIGKQAVAELRREGTLPPRYVESIATVVGVHLSTHYLRRGQNRSLPTLTPNTQQRVLAYIQARLATRILLADLARVAGLSPFHFTRAFRVSVGETPHQFIIRQRVERARELLRTSGQSMTLTDAALQAGFSSQSHLTRCFRGVCGMTPGEFLRKER